MIHPRQATFLPLPSFFFTPVLLNATTPSDQPPPSSCALAHARVNAAPPPARGTLHFFIEATLPLLLLLLHPTPHLQDPTPVDTFTTPTRPIRNRAPRRPPPKSVERFHCSTSILMDQIEAEDSNSFTAPPF